MVTKAFSGGRLVMLGAAVVFLTAGFAYAAPPRMPHPLPHGRPIGHFAHPVHHAFYRPHYGGHGYHSGYRIYYPYYGHTYGQAYGGYGGYYTDYGYASDYGAALYSPVTSAPTAEEKHIGALLAASGVPTEEGRPVWPVALRVLPGQEAQALRGQIDALLQGADTDAAQGRPNTAAVEELTQATDHFRKLLLRHEEERGVLAKNSYDEAKRFLDKLAGAQKLLR